MLLTLSIALLMATQSGLPPRRPSAQVRPQRFFTAQELAQLGYRRLTGAALKRHLLGKSVSYPMRSPNAPPPSIQVFKNDMRIVRYSDIWQIEGSYFFKENAYCINSEECYSVFRKGTDTYISRNRKEGITKPYKVNIL